MGLNRRNNLLVERKFFMGKRCAVTACQKILR